MFVIDAGGILLSNSHPSLAELISNLKCAEQNGTLVSGVTGKDVC